MKFALITLLVIAGFQELSGQNHEDRPNIIFILADDFGYNDIGVYNPATFYETPNLDGLAHSGLLFTNAYGSNPVCSPTRYSIMSGKYPTRIDATDWFCGNRSDRFLPAEMNCYMPQDEFTIAEAFKEAGYSTFFAGKWHLGDNPELWPENQGFDINKGGWTAGSPQAHGGGGYFSPYNNPRLEDGEEGEYLTDRLTLETKKFLRSHVDEPFFVFLSFYQVHNPLQAPEELISKYEEKARRLNLTDVDVFAEEEQVWSTDDPRRVRIVQNHPVFAAMVESMDNAIGKVLSELERLGLDENTVVVFTSDDGGLSTSEGLPTSNLPFRGGKGWLYEGGLRAPLMIRWPGVISSGIEDTPIIGTDFYPTLLEIAGLPLQKEQHLDGISFASLLKGGDRPAREGLFWHYPHYSNQGGFPGGAIRMGDWKLIERYEDGQVHLYNLAEDIGEKNDLGNQYPDRVKQMRKKLHEWYKEVDAKFLRQKNDGPEPWRPE